MQGTSSLYVWNCDVLMQGTGALSVLHQAVPGEASLTGEGFLYATITIAASRSTLPALRSSSYSSDFTDIGTSFSYLPAAASTAYGSAYVPTEPDMGYGNLPVISAASTGHDIDKGQSDVSLPAFIAQAGMIDDASVGQGGTYNQYFPPMYSIGVWGEALDLSLVSGTLGLASVTIVPDLVLVLNSYGQVASVFATTRMLAAEFISAATASGTLSLLGTFNIEFIEALFGEDFIISYNSSTEGGALDASSQVWVVNLETGASSQYEGFGFNSFMEQDGQYYGLADDGIYLLGGPDDNGIDIPTYIDFGETQCGVPGRKKVLNIHVGTSEGGQTYMRVKTAVGPNTVTETYRLEETQRGPYGWRAKVPPHRQGEYWNFELISNDAFELTGVEFSPARLSRRM